MAETILTNGVIHPMTREGERHEALALSDGRILAIGARDEILELRGPKTAVIDLDGGSAFPGFADTHTHLLGAATMRANDADLGPEQGITSVAAALDAIASLAAVRAPGSWLLGVQYRDDLVAERRFPTRRELDSAAPDHPVLIRGIGGHVCTANSRAFAISGVGAGTPDPPGGTIERDEHGQPTGILKERGKFLLTGHMPRYGVSDFLQALGSQVRPLLLEHGITSVGVVTTSHDEVEAYIRASEQGLLPPRTRLMLRIFESEFSVEDVAALAADERLQRDQIVVDGIKVSVDGVWGNAAVYEPYPGTTDDLGIVRVPQEDLDDVVRRARGFGMRSSIHAIGPRAYDMALDAFERAGTREEIRSERHRIEHLGLLPIPADTLRRCRALNVIASPQPAFLYEYGDTMVEAMGEKAMQGGFCFRSLVDAGLTVIGSSDMNCTTASVLTAVQAATTRTTRHGTVLYPDQALSVYEALQMYTSNTAYAEFSEDTRGVLEPAKRADITVLAKDPFAVAPSELDTIDAALTIVGGEVVYDGRA